MATSTPDLSDVQLPFKPTLAFVAGVYDPNTLREALCAQDGLDDFEDDSGPQSAVYLTLDADPEANPGYWVAIPESVDPATISAAVAAYTPPPPPSTIATASDIASASGPIIDANLADLEIEREHLEAIFAGLLSQAKSAIPYYEGYTLKPDPATAWTNFQKLDQATKDRLLYNVVRSLAAMMRYLTGDLPTA